MRTRAWYPVAAAVIAVAVDALYLTIIWQEGEGELTSGRVLFVAVSLVCAAVALVLGRFAEPKPRAALFAAAAGVLVAWTVLGAFSIGILVAPATVLAVLSALEALQGSRSAALAGVVAAVATTTAGLLLT